MALGLTSGLTRKVDDRTLVSDSYGITMPMFPERPDIPAEERQRAREADQIFQPELLKAYRWTIEQLDYAQGKYGFPKSLGFTGVANGAQRKLFYSRAAIVAWRAEFDAFVATLK